MGRDPLSGSAAWRVADELLEHPNFRFAKEPDGLQRNWRELTPAQQASRGSRSIAAPQSNATSQ
jgi:hypothetical protein